jgi:hypothetical protein
LRQLRPHTHEAAVVMKHFNFSKDRHSENLKMIFHINNTDYDFRYINISNLLQPYIAAVIEIGTVKLFLF